ncbi:MAG TPA: hypothetical protein VF791_10775 [Pyrinomonadaceae bacterium]
MYSKTAHSLICRRAMSSLLRERESAIMPPESAAGLQRFVRRTQLNSHEYRTNFRQLDCDVISALVSDEACQVTSQMSKVYLSLINAPAELWERDGVLRFTGCEEGEKCKTAWEQLVEIVGVASATARKALAWMSEQAVIGYHAGKNGVGIRIFINRASSSIGRRAPQAGQKILSLVPASSHRSRTSANEAAFNDSFAVREVSDTDFNSRAPENGAEDKMVVKTSPEPNPELDTHGVKNSDSEGREVETPEPKVAGMLSINEIVQRLKSELEPSLQSAAQQAARREHERTREWLENRGLPKAARVAQREAYNVLRNHGVINAANERVRADLEVGRNHSTVEAKLLSEGEIKELAEMCIAMLETHGQAIDTTLAEISSEAGGCLLPEDAPKVRALAENMLQESKR